MSIELSTMFSSLPMRALSVRSKFWMSKRIILNLNLNPNMVITLYLPRFTAENIKYIIFLNMIPASLNCLMPAPSAGFALQLDAHAEYLYNLTRLIRRVAYGENIL